jgi:endonuclease/exonuclease/phosphatase family metal-dependent hydrolase
MKKRNNFIVLIVVILVFTALHAQSFRIATFNIQNFGQSKMAKTDVVDTLAMIVRQFDIVAVQEISDISNQTAGAFLKVVNASGVRYKLSCSERTGAQPDDRKSAEQYAFYYDSKTVSLTEAALYPDVNDDFQREPYVASFTRKADSLTFVVCTIHTAPKQAVEEIAALAKVAKWIPTHFKNAKMIIFCGDFNASCSYASPSELQALAIHKSPYYWVVPDNADTNLAKNACAYDRFVVTENLRSYVGGWDVYRAFKSKKVSDHWPVVLKLEGRK